MASSEIRYREGPFAILPEWLLDSGVSDRAIRLYAVLARYADAEGHCFPSRATLATRLSCSRDSVDRAIQALIEIGALSKEERRGRDGGATSNLYTLEMGRNRAPQPQGSGPPSREDAAQNKSHPERDSQPTAEGVPQEPAPKRARRRTPRDGLFDALVEVFGPASTTQRAAFYGRTVSGLVEASATPELIRLAAGEMRRRGWTKPTPEAMAKHWDDLVGHQGEGARRAAVEAKYGTNPAAWPTWDEEAMAEIRSVGLGGGP